MFSSNILIFYIWEHILLKLSVAIRKKLMRRFLWIVLIESLFYKLITLFLFPFKIGMFNLIIFILSNLLILPTENFGNIWDLVLKADSHIISLHYFWQLEITERSLSKIQLLLFISINSFPYIVFNKIKMTKK